MIGWSFQPSNPSPDRDSSSSAAEFHLRLLCSTVEHFGVKFGHPEWATVNLNDGVILSDLDGPRIQVLLVVHYDSGRSAIRVNNDDQDVSINDPDVSWVHVNDSMTVESLVGFNAHTVYDEHSA